jgi:predicted GIY-YIG superfamily endonuclease
MNDKIIHLNNKFEKLLESELISYQDVCLLENIVGVYIIYNHKSEIIYIGSTINFTTRFNKDLKHKSTHTLVRKLIKSKEFVNSLQVLEYLKTQCKMKNGQCITKREAEALEHIAIYILNPTYNRE